MVKEVKFKKRGSSAIFVIDNEPDCDICQLFIKDKTDERGYVMINWVRQKLFIDMLKAKDDVIGKLQVQLANKNNEIAKLKGERK